MIMDGSQNRLFSNWVIQISMRRENFTLRIRFCAIGMSVTQARIARKS